MSNDGVRLWVYVTKPYKGAKCKGYQGASMVWLDDEGSVSTINCMLV